MRGGGYVAKRILFAVVTVYVAVTLNFILFRVLPGSAVSNVSRVPQASPALKHALEVEFGLNHSLWEQYWIYLKQLAHGNLGVSFANQQPVWDNLRHALWHTLPMVALGTVIAILIGIATGILSATRRGSVADHASTNLAIVFYAFPTQFLGMMLLLLFAGILPAGGMSNPFLLAVDPTSWQKFSDVVLHMILPAATLALTLYGEDTLIVRSAMLETLCDDYVLTARAKGYCDVGS